jgi:hypothetical protein
MPQPSARSKQLLTLKRRFHRYVCAPNEYRALIDKGEQEEDLVELNDKLFYETHSVKTMKVITGIYQLRSNTREAGQSKGDVDIYCREVTCYANWLARQ